MRTSSLTSSFSVNWQKVLNVWGLKCVVKTWYAKTADRDSWRSKLKRGKIIAEAKLAERAEARSNVDSTVRNTGSPTVVSDKDHRDRKKFYSLQAKNTSFREYM